MGVSQHVPGNIILATLQHFQHFLLPFAILDFSFHIHYPINNSILREYYKTMSCILIVSKRFGHRVSHRPEHATLAIILAINYLFNHNFQRFQVK